MSKELTHSESQKDVIGTAFDTMHTALSALSAEEKPAIFAAIVEALFKGQGFSAFEVAGILSAVQHRILLDVANQSMVHEIIES